MISSILAFDSVLNITLGENSSLMISIIFLEAFINDLILLGFVKSILRCPSVPRLITLPKSSESVASNTIKESIDGKFYLIFFNF